MNFQNMSYVPGEDYGQPELIVIRKIGAAGRQEHHMVAAMAFLYDGLRVATNLANGGKAELSQEEVLLVCEFIRQNRNAIKFGSAPKTYEDWQRRGVPLEDYLPLGYSVGSDWLDNFARIAGADSLIQLATPYEEPFDRPQMEADVHYTFANKRGEWRFAGICAYNNPINLVPELRFYAKIESRGPEQVEYFEKQWGFDTRVMHYRLYRRPFTASYLSRAQYLEEAGSMSWQSPLTEQEITAEAYAIQWKLQYSSPNSSVWETPNEIRIILSDDFSSRATAENISALISELPYSDAKCHDFTSDSGERKMYFAVPIAEYKQSIGLGAAHKRDIGTPTQEHLEQLRQESDTYYLHGKEYFVGKMLCTFYRYHSDMDSEDQGVFLDAYGHSVFCVAADMWRNLPDIAESGSEIVAVADSRYQPIPYLMERHRAYVEHVQKHGVLAAIGGRCSFTTSWGHEKNAAVSYVPDGGDDRCIVRADDGTFYYVQKQDLLPEREELGNREDYPGKPFVRFSAMYSIQDESTLRFVKQFTTPPFSDEESGVLCEYTPGAPAILFPDGSRVVFRHEDLVDMAHQFKLCADAGYAADVSWACREAG